MPVQHLLFVAVLAMLTTGCGRVGVGLLPERPTPMPDASFADAGTTAYGGAGFPAIDAPADAGSATNLGGGALASADPVDAGLGFDAGAGAPADASTSAPDAATTTQVDAAMAPPSDAATQLPCGGSRALGLCWYFSDPETSCNDSCSSRGGFDSRAAQYVDTTSQGGSAGACRQILTALGEPGSVVTATRDDGLGLGCHVWTDGTRFWLDDPSPLFTPSPVAPPQVSIACACAR
jgi:hypothetical protein